MATPIDQFIKALPSVKNGVREIMKKFKESSAIKILSGRGRKAKISKTLEPNMIP